MTFDRVIERSSVILSICPPHAALDVAAQVAATGNAGNYVDANAISVATAEQVSGIVTAAGATYVDGGIIGMPPEIAATPGSTCPARAPTRSASCSAGRRWTRGSPTARSTPRRR